MSEIDSGGNAFPHCEWVGDVHTHRVGMSLREWYAGVALQGLLSNPSINFERSSLSACAFSFADKMLRAGEGENK